LSPTSQDEHKKLSLSPTSPDEL